MTARKTALGLLLLLSACGGGGGGPVDGGGTTAAETVAGYCDQFWTAYAARWAICDRASAAYWAAFYAPALRCGDPVQAVTAGRATYDQARATACLGFLAAGSCDAIEAQVSGRLLQADCQAAVTGLLGAGATCHSPESCASDVCLESPYCPSACFTPHVLGASCTDEPLCVPGLHCDRRYAPTAFTCQPLEAQGRFCVDDADCQLGLRCDTGAPGASCQPRRTSGYCADDGYCAAGYACKSGSCVWPKAAGETCTQGQNQCAAGLWCSGGFCLDGPTAGQPCTAVNGETRPCIGAACVSGTCVAWSEGGACTTAAECAPGASCAYPGTCAMPCPEP